MENVIKFIYEQRKWIIYDKSWDDFLNGLIDTDYFPLWKKVGSETYFFIRLRADYEDIL